MTQTHHPQNTPGQDPPTQGGASGAAEPTTPIWYGEHAPTGYPQAAPGGEHAPTGYPQAAPGREQPRHAGQPRQGEHPAFSQPAAYGPVTTELPAGPPPPANPRTGAEQAQPAKRRRWTDLTVVALLAAALASGGTYAATQLDDGQTSSAATSSSLGRGADQPPVSQADPNNPNWTATAAAVSPSVVAISVQSQQGSGQGSGVVIDDKGHILTNNHVVAGGESGTISVTLSDGRSYEAEIAGTDPSTDLAVITVKNPPEELKPIALGDSDALKVGDPVMAIGNPLGLSGTVTTGIVSALNRPVQTQEEQQGQGDSPFGVPGQQPEQQSEPVVTNAIQTSAAINPGNSGGALVNASGQLVGINSSIASLGSNGQSGSIGIGFAIPVNEAKAIAQQLIDKGKAEHAFLGVTSQNGTATDGSAKRTGAKVVSVEQGTPAAEAGLREGDTVVAVDGELVDSSTSLVAHIRERTVGDTVKLTVLRDGKELEITATLAVRPATSQ